MLIVNEVSKRGVKINFFLLRLLIIKYAEQYKQMTRQETGRVGALFYYWIASINLALVSFAVAFVV
jgi:hypothetical protein